MLFLVLAKDVMKMYYAEDEEDSDGGGSSGRLIWKSDVSGYDVVKLDT